MLRIRSAALAESLAERSPSHSRAAIRPSTQFFSDLARKGDKSWGIGVTDPLLSFAFSLYTIYHHDTNRRSVQHRAEKDQRSGNERVGACLFPKADTGRNLWPRARARG